MRDLIKMDQPVIDGVICLLFHLGETTVLNNFTKWHQNGFKIGIRDKYMYATQLFFKLDS